MGFVAGACSASDRHVGQRGRLGRVRDDPRRVGCGGSAVECDRAERLGEDGHEHRRWSLRRVRTIGDDVANVPTVIRNGVSQGRPSIEPDAGKRAWL